MIACQSKIFIKSGKTTGNLKLTGCNYFLTAGESTFTGATAGESTFGESTTGAGVSTFGESVVAGVSSFFVASLQAAKDTDTIAKAKITFFILCFV